MRNAIGIFVATACIVVASWWWRGLPVEMPAQALAAGEKLHCVSYAPFRGTQTPLDPTTQIPPAQIQEDLAKLSTTTSCVRIYSVDMGLDRVPEIAAQHNLQVLLGIWISGEAKRNREQVAAGVALANRHPQTVRAIIVGNEVLLRGEQSGASLKAIIESVRAQTKVPITYADVWEFWLQNRELSSVVDFVTVHILPYWEDLPIPARDAAAHIASIRARVASEFPGKDVLIGEAGWPSQGRMREGARPSPIDQARVLHDLLALARAERFNVNLIEAFDQPWKRHLEGTVGGYWGLWDGDRRMKFVWGQPISNVPNWGWQAAAGVILAGAVIALGLVMPGQRNSHASSRATQLAVAIVALAAGCLSGQAVDAALVEGLGLIGWSRSTLQAVVAIATPLVAAAALGAAAPMPAFAEVIGPRDRRKSGVARLSGLCAIATAIVATESALGLVFNPRYLDFPTASVTAAAVSLAALAFVRARPGGERPAAETVIALMLALSIVKILWAETVANWQAVWLSAAFLLLAVTLARARLARG